MKITNIEDLKNNLKVEKLEDRLEMVQVAAMEAAASDDKGSDDGCHNDSCTINNG